MYNTFGSLQGNADILSVEAADVTSFESSRSAGWES